jgi:hypothetical protein
MIRSISIVLFVGIGACGVDRAPGTRPADMSAQAHLDECKRHLAIAQDQEQRNRYMAQVRGYVSAAHAGGREREIARQHGEAARELDPHAPVCP